MHLLSRPEAVIRYGAINDGQWPEEKEWLTTVAVPPAIHLTYEKKPVLHLTCNKDMAGPLELALKSIIERGFAKELRTYGGCFNIRPVRGSQSIFSWHAYGLAIDLNPDRNPLGGASSWSDGLVHCFKEEGFVWGGDFHGRKDPMHFQWGIG
jgi:hypothetical protein